MKITLIEATSIPDLWFQSLYNIFEEGLYRKIHKGSYKGQHRLEYSYFIGHIKNPWLQPLMPEMPETIDIPAPVDKEYLDKYIYNFLLGDEGRIVEQYTYHSRMNNVKSYGSQVQKIIDEYKDNGYNTNQNIIQIGRRDDLFELSDPPCLRQIDTRIESGALHFICYFRSWDLWGGMPANLAALQTLKAYMAEEIDVKDGELVVESKGLHLYDHCYDIARRRCNMSFEVSQQYNIL